MGNVHVAHSDYLKADAVRIVTHAVLVASVGDPVALAKAIKAYAKALKEHDAAHDLMYLEARRSHKSAKKR